jgi:hypothetical protein
MGLNFSDRQAAEDIYKAAFFILKGGNSKGDY